MTDAAVELCRAFNDCGWHWSDWVPMLPALAGMVLLGGRACYDRVRNRFEGRNPGG